ncbi:MAG TPA: dihydrolipoyl dehydrogenase [Anaerolineae bacterium]|nr:dihydrolipoyl dehydrogenase [Anaerolineae bacterium]
MAERFDIAIVGAGVGGYVAAIRAAQLGARVALIERERVGGVCLNWGCIPTKAMVSSIELLLELERAEEFGVILAEPAFDFARMMSRKDEVVERLVSGVESLLEMHKVDVISGVGEFVSPTQVKVTGGSPREIEAQKVIVATGSRPTMPPVPGLDLPGVVTSNDVVSLKEPPDDLVIVGGGVIGVEFASIFNALGTKVTIVEMLPSVLTTVDEELARRHQQLLRRQGVDVHTKSPLKEVRQRDGGLEVVYEEPTGEGAVVADMVLMATGRVPHTDGLHLEKIGVKVDKGAIAVNEHMATNVPGVYAIGDVTGGFMLAHVASREGEVAAEHALGRESSIDYRAVPNCVFSLPEIAGVGLTEQEAKERGLAYKKSRFPFTASGRALAMGQTAGMVKMICDESTGRVLGLHIMGPHATDLIAEGALAVRSGATADDIVQTIHAHPTLPEAVREAAMGQAEGPIHART